MMQDPRDLPVADKQVRTADIETTPTGTDMISVLNAAQDALKAITLADLFGASGNAPNLTNLITTITKLVLTPVEYTASGAISADVSYVELNTASGAMAMTIAAPAAGRLLIITQTDTGTDGHTVTCTAGDFDGTGASGDVATFNAAEETLILFGISATRWVIVANIGSVAIG